MDETPKTFFWTKNQNLKPFTTDDKKFHMNKGTRTYKCDNCNKKLANKTNLENSINKEYITCNRCMKILPTININITSHYRSA